MAHLAPWRKREREAHLARREHQAQDPFTMLNREMNRLLENFQRGFDLAPFAEGEGEWAPRVNITQNDKEVTVTAELSGIDEKNVEINLTNDVLAIRGQKLQEVEDKTRDFYFSERVYGNFERSIQLPAEVEADKAEAKFDKGVLTVRLPKTPKAQSDVKKIPVKSQ